MTADQRSEPAAGPDSERRSDPQGQPPSGGDRRQAHAGAAAAYAAAQHAADARAGHTSQVQEDHVDTKLEDDPDAGPAVPDELDAANADVSGVSGVDPTADGSPEHQPPQDLDELTAKAQKADEYLALAQRTQADFENYRKRAARDAALAQERGIAKLAKELLPAIDNLDRALAAVLVYAAPNPSSSGSADPDSGDADAQDGPAPADPQLINGLRLVHAEVLAALARVGIEPFSPVGEPFDPQHHEAVAQQPFEGQASGTVVEVYQQGFRLGEAVLRPARVLVAA